MNLARANVGHQLARLAGREGRERLVRFGLIPVRDGGEVEREVVVVAVFDRHPQRLLEAYRVGQMKAVHVRAPEPARLAIDAGVAEERVLVQGVGRPRRVEVVLGARAVQ